MFRSKRSILVKSLMRYKVASSNHEHETQCQMEIPENDEIEKIIYRMLKRLKASQLEVLVHSLTSKGKEKTGCVMVPNVDPRINGHSESIVYICCKRWRWKDLGSVHDLKRLHWCYPGYDSPYVCINPYHWCRLFNTEYPPPPYTLNYPILNLEEWELRQPDPTISSEATGGADGFVHPLYGEPWGIMAYWEMLERVGPLLPLWTNNVEVSYDLSQEDGVRLKPLIEEANRPPEDTPKCVLKTRQKIGYGLSLCREGDEVWLYNRSKDHPVFLDSSTLDPPFTPVLTVYKVPPGCALAVFDFSRSRQYRALKPPSDLASSELGHSQYKSVRISFAKGWSSKYCRTCIGNCPCWLEILFNVKS